MKILMLCDFYNEALEYQENLLAKYYIKHGHQVTVVTSTFESVFDYYNDRHDNRVPARTYEHNGAKIIKLRYRYNLLNRLRAFTSIAGVLDQESPDLIYVHDIIPNMLEAVRYKRQHPGCRMIFDYHADYSNSGKNWLSLKILHGVLRKWFLDRTRPDLSRIFPIVPSGATFLHEVYGVPHHEMELLPLGADTDLGGRVRDAGARVRLRRAYGVADDDIVIFTGGKLDPLKRTEELIKAFKCLPQDGVHLLVIGDSSESHQSYKQMLTQLADGADNIRFVGWQSALGVYEHLDLADIAVFPASQSVLWQQAISMGLPLVIGDRIVAAKGKQDVAYLNLEDNIIILDPSRPMADELNSHLKRLIADPGKRRQMAKGARRVTNQMLTWDTLIEKTLRFNSEATRSESTRAE